jgi:hypothetical protein
MYKMGQKCTLCDMNVLLLNSGCGNDCVSKRCSHSKSNSKSNACYGFKLSCTYLIPYLICKCSHFLYCREDGNAAYQEGKHELAILLYTEAMRSVISITLPNVHIPALQPLVNVQIACPTSLVLMLRYMHCNPV